jgi:hypothetical protein
MRRALSLILIVGSIYLGPAVVGAPLRRTRLSSRLINLIKNVCCCSMEEPKGEGGGGEGPPRPTMTRRVSYNRDSLDGNMDADDFSRNVSIDSSKLNEFLYKVRCRDDS